MGVAIVGFAAFRDEEGKLCRFEYGSTPSWFINLLRGLQYRFSTRDSDARQSAFSRTHSKEIQQFSKLWGNFIAEKGKLY